MFFLQAYLGIGSTYGAPNYINVCVCVCVCVCACVCGWVGVLSWIVCCKYLTINIYHLKEKTKSLFLLLSESVLLTPPTDPIS